MAQMPVKRGSKFSQLCLASSAILLASFIATRLPANSDSPPNNFPGASVKPQGQSLLSLSAAKLDTSSSSDEASSGLTFNGTTVSKRTAESFPADPRNLFWQMDKVLTVVRGNWQRKLESQSFDTDGDKQISDSERDAIRGRNTWILWSEGNESFWEWFQEKAYGVQDFLTLIDSRNRDHRFRNTGLINQPGLIKRDEPSDKILGLYIDASDKDSLLKGGPEDFAVTSKKDKGKALITAPVSQPRHLFNPGDKKLYDKIIRQLPKDGVDPNVYGYPSGVIGLRLFPNPDFFGDSDDAAKARSYWHERVEKTNDAYYTDVSISADPKLIRPFRVGITAGLFHVGMHPIVPPDDSESPKWQNLSSIIGNQFLEPYQIFGNRLASTNFFRQALFAQQPGTFDTSFIDTDHIANASAIDSIWETSGRSLRALANPPEEQSPANLLIPSLEENLKKTNPRHVPHIQLDGADSTGLQAALSRAYLSFGTFGEEWNRCQNPIIGLSGQKPFSIETLNAKSAYWQNSQKYTVPYLAAFLTAKSAKSSITSAMRYNYMNEGVTYFANGADHTSLKHGTELFMQNCAVCHSSKQPDGFDMTFADDWKQKGEDTTAPLHLVAPTQYEDWGAFTESLAYRKYVDALSNISQTWNVNFFDNNYYSTDIRIPVTLIGTNSARAVATNSMAGQLWDNFSSETYKKLPAVGAVKFYNPYSPTKVDKYGRNDVYYPPAGGPGYMRPTSLASLWTTAPYLHTNALGQRLEGPSIKKRMAAFDDGTKKLLFAKERNKISSRAMGDLRKDAGGFAEGDPGFIYRTTDETYIELPRKFIRPLIEQMASKSMLHFLTIYLWIGLIALNIFMAWKAGTKTAAIITAVGAISSAMLCLIVHVSSVFPELWLVPIVLAAAAGVFWWLRRFEEIGRVFFSVTTITCLILAIGVNEFINGSFADIKLGPIPKGVPVNLILNINPAASTADLIDAYASLFRGMQKVQRSKATGKEALKVFETECAQPLMKVNKCPDFVLDEGHWFGEELSDEDKKDLVTFLRSI